MPRMTKAIRFSVLFAVRFGGHQFADYWLQTDHQSTTKDKPGLAGALPCLRHVLTYSLVNAGAVALANKVFGLGLSARGQVAGELISALSHYAADRREYGLLFPLADGLKKGFYLRHRGGQPDLDQSWHHVFNTTAAGVTAVIDAE